MTARLGIILPSFNAADTLVGTIDRIPQGLLSELQCDLRLYVVNDGSTDRTRLVLEQLNAATCLAVSVLDHRRNRGYGAAQKTGLEASLRDGNEYHVILHADGQYAPEELPEVLAPLLDGSTDVVIGSKFARGQVLRQGMPLSRMVGIRLLDRVENLVYGLKGLEFHSGYMAYSSAALRRISFASLTDGFHFDGEMVVTTARAGLRVVRVPISTHYGDSYSSLKVPAYLWEVLWSVVRNVRGKKA